MSAALLPLQVLQAVGVFELQIEQLQNTNGLLLGGGCCDGGGGGGAGGRCPQADQCDTFLRACLKEYQVRVSPTGPCTFGAGSTGVLGGNSFSLRHRTPGEQVGRIGIPFKYAWPKSFSLVLEVLDHDNDTVGAGRTELLENVVAQCCLCPGLTWASGSYSDLPDMWVLGRQGCLSQYCSSNLRCVGNRGCQGRGEVTGHSEAQQAGCSVCSEFSSCFCLIPAVCRQGCHLAHGYCSTPGECKCHYGWEGPLCDRCVTFPGCVHGSCTEPWMCVCDTNWGGLLCDKECGFSRGAGPRTLGAHTGGGFVVCLDLRGSRGEFAVEHACLSNPCANGGTCVEEAEGFYCVCPEGWTGPSCTTGVNECQPNPCSQGGTCRQLQHGFECLCPPQWTGRTCQLDTNECDRGVCVHAVACHNLIGGYFCDCQPGWTGQDCDITNHTCQGKCQNGAVCEESLTGYRCQCPPGFTGSYCQTRASHCDSAPCLNGGHCAEEEETPQCHCPLGYSGKHCEEVLDLCNPNPCQQGAPCQSTEGGYLCACPQGYEGKECLSLKDTCHEPHCQGEPSGSTGSGSTLYVVMVVLLAMLVVGTTLCIYLLAQLRRRRKERQHAGQDEGINNQRECVTLIRNLGGPPPVPRCREEIELSLPPTPETKKPRRSSAKLDISNREREKLNRFHFSDSQEVEV
uniref:EGF-like domain-containing protein n=1 Tax=Lepisosteus oculatus TaxID=7918 RepID=W5NBN2_LEPOC